MSISFYTTAIWRKGKKRRGIDAYVHPFFSVPQERAADGEAGFNGGPAHAGFPKRDWAPPNKQRACATAQALLAD